MDKLKRILTVFLPAAAGLVIVYAIAVYRGLSPEAGLNLNARYLSDGFFAAGVLYTGIGLLVWISTTGFFDIFGYGVHSLLVLFTALRRPENHESFLEYKERKQSGRQKPRPGLLLTGVAFIALSVVCLVVYYS